MLFFKKFLMQSSRNVILAVSFLVLVLVISVFWFFYSAPPGELIITAGPKGSLFDIYATRYRKILARNGVNLKVVNSEGSVDNLKNLMDKKYKADIGFVQGGIVKKDIPNDLVSLGSVAYEPLYIFYRGSRNFITLSEMEGMRLAIGEIGSGTQELALLLLSNNGIKPDGRTKLLNLDSDNAAGELLKGNIDAVFMMGDSVSRDKIKMLLSAPGIRIFDFVQANAYTGHIKYLHKLNLPMGGINFGKNIPSHDVTLVGPTIELIARKNLHPALSDLLLEAATEVHSGAGMLKKKGEFPAVYEEDFTLSPDAKRFYKSGQSLLYRELPFWIASMINRLMLIILPLLVIFPTVIRGLPAAYRWFIRMRLLGWYGDLLEVERKLVNASAEEKVSLLKELDEIEARINSKVPSSFADQFYALRGHINFVRGRANNS